MNEALIAALSGVGTAVAGLTAVLWRLQRANSNNGHQQTSHQLEEIRLLTNIDAQSAIVARESAAAAKTLDKVAEEVHKVAEGVAVLRDRSER